MASLTVRDIPKTLLDRMRRAAKMERRSLNSQAVQWLDQGAKHWTTNAHLGELLDVIRADREAKYRQHGPGSDSVELVRKMRQRG